MRALLATALWLLCLGASTSIAAECDEMTAGVGTPRYKGNPPPAVTRCRNGYLLSHNDERLTPDWVAERLVPPRFRGPADRDEAGNPFAPDPTLARGRRAELKDYRGSGFDRGHMAPAADMRYSKQAMVESFYLSNMAPQVGLGLNRDIWADLEGLARTWTCARGELVAFTGPIYDDDPPKTISDSKLAVPTAFYKIVYDPNRKRAIAFILPNRKVDRKGQTSWEVLKENHIVAIAEVEQRTGLDFLTALSRRDQNRLEKTKSIMWPAKADCSGR